jgi:hypothetical protein
MKARSTVIVLGSSRTWLAALPTSLATGGPVRAFRAPRITRISV